MFILFPWRCFVWRSRMFSKSRIQSFLLQICFWVWMRVGWPLWLLLRITFVAMIQTISINLILFLGNRHTSVRLFFRTSCINIFLLRTLFLRVSFIPWRLLITTWTAGIFFLQEIRPFSVLKMFLFHLILLLLNISRIRPNITTAWSFILIHPSVVSITVSYRTLVLISLFLFRRPLIRSTLILHTILTILPVLTMFLFLRLSLSISLFCWPLVLRLLLCSPVLLRWSLSRWSLIMSTFLLSWPRSLALILVVWCTVLIHWPLIFLFVSRGLISRSVFLPPLVG